ncbi:hypothetical protein [Pseudanabaena sp. FACHB-2040]|uniref:hypothetical protein n=1 Tax=Pseudanabaena sp. FACHB-2040 TaxID=2692859 RepID=UPI001683F9B2|nr:hypothetical protein [Pseudanabaena sp. FACHB-2040]MBD2256287.1 hypothetical protein [Pseudanabaena sp. FACHB-2040]
MDTTVVVVAGIIALVALIVVFVFRDRLLELSVNGREGSIQARMEAKGKAIEDIQDEKPVNVVFKGNKLRGEGEYRMQRTDFSENDIDGKQKLELGYDEPSNNALDEEDQ